MDDTILEPVGGVNSGERFGFAETPPVDQRLLRGVPELIACPMCVRVPVELQELVLRDIRRSRLRSSIIYFPVLLLIFGAIAAGLVFIKGHGIVEMLRRLVGDILSDSAFWMLLIGGIVLCVGGGLVFFLRQMYRECCIEQHRFCSACKAVDSDDEGCCPVCRKPLAEEAGFFSTYYTDEKKLLERYGLLPYTES